MASTLLPRDPTNLGGYTLTGRLGSGGFGVIYQAVTSSGDQVAIKLLNGANSLQIKRFEPILLKRASHSSCA